MTTFGPAGSYTPFRGACGLRDVALLSVLFA